MIRPPGAVKHPQTKEIKVGSTIALPLDQFESMHLAFGLAITVLQRERGANRIIFAIKSLCKPTEFGKPNRFGFSDPTREESQLTPVDQGPNIRHELIRATTLCASVPH